MKDVYIVIRNDKGPDEITAKHAWLSYEDAESWAHELRKLLGCSLDTVEVICLSVGGTYDNPS